MKKTITYTLYGLLGLAILIAAAGLFSRDDISIPDGLKGKYVDIGGEKIRVHQQGAGLDVLLIHGLPGCIEDWDPVMDRLAKKYRVTVYDRPGHGFSGAKKAGYSLASNADTAIELMRVLGLKNVTVAGHSYGGGITLAMAVRKPAAVKGYVSVAGVSYPVGHIDPAFYPVLIPLLGRGFAVIASNTMGTAMVKEGMKNAFSPNDNYLTDEILKLRMRVFLQPKVIVSVAHEEITINRELPALIAAYPDIRAPFHILHGSGDLLLPYNDSRQLAKVVAGSRLTVLDGVGHQVQFVRPETVIAAVDAIARK
ncbi:MAG TPA: alpha/beta hydrolase [Spirochaetes bacterium]|nr:alpha/beta hydrolase [Spirochaetota bacterium]